MRALTRGGAVGAPIREEHHKQEAAAQPDEGVDQVVGAREEHWSGVRQRQSSVEGSPCASRRPRLRQRRGCVARPLVLCVASMACVLQQRVGLRVSCRAARRNRQSFTVSAASTPPSKGRGFGSKQKQQQQQQGGGESVAKTGFKEEGAKSNAEGAAAKARDVLAAKSATRIVGITVRPALASPSRGANTADSDALISPNQEPMAEVRDTEPDAAPLLGDPAFEARLSALKASSAAVLAVKQASEGSVLDASPLSVLDTPIEASTLPPPSDRDSRGEQSGTPGVVRGGAALIVIALAVVFGLSSASDLVFSTTSGSTPTQLSAASKAKLGQLVDEFDAGTPDKALALASAASQLERHAEAATAYTAALASLPPGDSNTFTALTGLVDASIAAGQAKEALGAVTAFEAAHAAELKSQDSTYGGLDATEVALLRAKATAAAGDKVAALEVLDKLIDERPEDFRPLLAKGLQLRNAGRQLAAEKVLLKARFLAPKEARLLVDQLIGDDR